MAFILGSSSAPRLELLAQLGYQPDKIISPQICEAPHKDELPRLYTQRIAKAKCDYILEKLTTKDQTKKNHTILCADTVIAIGRRILGKPKDKDDAKAMLKLLSGRRHRVYSALIIHHLGKDYKRISENQIKFKRLTPQEIDTYIASNEWQNKAGAYAIQGRASAFIPWISGSHSAIIGLPLYETAQLLTALGIQKTDNDKDHDQTSFNR